MHEQNRVLHLAILVSLAVHALLLAAFPERRAALWREEPALPLIARLIEPEPPKPPVPVVQPAPPPALPPEPEAKPEPKPKPRPKAKQKPKPAPQTAPPVAAVAPQPAIVQADPPPPKAPEVPPVAVPTPPVAAPAQPPAVVYAPQVVPQPAPSAEAVDAGALAQYRRQLLSVAHKYKRYPRVAVDNNWEGDVLVHLAIGADGRIASLTVKSGSGHAVLDRQALEMFRKAMPLVDIPPALRGREFTLDLRAIYSLRDQGSG